MVNSLKAILKEYKAAAGKITLDPPVSGQSQFAQVQTLMQKQIAKVEAVKVTNKSGPNDPNAAEVKNYNQISR